MLDQFERDETVFQRFFMGIHSYEVYSYEELVQSSEKVFTLLEQCNQHISKSIRCWVDYERSHIDGILETHQQLEAEDARFQDS